MVEPQILRLSKSDGDATVELYDEKIGS